MRFLVLTKSAKNSGYCVAGIDLDENRLIRLVSDMAGNAISYRQFTYNEKHIEILSELDIACTPSPLSIQTENYILEKINSVNRIYSIDELDNIWETVENANLLKEGTYYVSPYTAQMIHKSLMIAEVCNFRTYADINNKNEKRTKARFSYNNQYFYDLSITDREFFAENIRCSKCKIVLSISEKPYNNKHYLFIAKIFPIK